MVLKEDLKLIVTTDIDQELETWYVDKALYLEAYLERDLNALFHARAWKNAENVKFDVNDYVTIGPYPLPGFQIDVPATMQPWSIYSRRPVEYGYVLTRCKLPSGLTGGVCYMGLEAGASSSLGYAFFKYNFETDKLWVTTNCGTIDISALQPANMKTAFHSYLVKMDNDMVWFYIDNDLVLIAVPNSVAVTIAGPPYFIECGSRWQPPIMPAFLETSIGANVLDWPIDMFVVFDGQPKPTRAMDLYQAGSDDTMRDAEIDAGSLTSHPVPILGYHKKTWNFMSDKAGTLLVEVYTMGGNWRTYDTIAVAANTLETYVMFGQKILGRLTFTPDEYTATILEAEVILDGN